jgi:hypothetical protein
MDKKKTMIINDSKRIADVQKTFRTKFPYLKLEFYKKQHDSKQGSPQREQYDSMMTIGKIRKKHDAGDLSIDPGIKVGDLERAFHQKYGLNVQVFRQSGGLWLQTITTDDWTLAEQNRHGEQSVKRTSV